MIAKGTTHNNGAKLAAYITTGKDGERAELWQLRGFEAADIKDAFRDVHIMAQATRCTQPFFHIQVRNPEGEKLIHGQWERVANRIESKLGCTGQPHAIAFHTDLRTGQDHMHLVISRIDQDTMTAKPSSFLHLRLKEVCRELEVDLGLTRVRNQRDTEVKVPRRNEVEQARRLGVNIDDVRDKIRVVLSVRTTDKALPLRSRKRV